MAFLISKGFVAQADNFVAVIQVGCAYTDGMGDFTLARALPNGCVAWAFTFYCPQFFNLVFGNQVFHINSFINCAAILASRASKLRAT